MEQIEAIVINKFDTGESDRVITLFNKEKGKIRVFIKGIRKSKNRELYATEPLVLGEYKLKKKNENYIADTFILKNPFFKIKDNFFKLELSIYLVKIIDKIIFENMSSEKLYKLFLNALIYIEKTCEKNKIILMISYFFYKIIEYEGLKIKIQGESYLNLEKRTIKNNKEAPCIYISKKEFKYIEKLNKVDIEGLNELKFSDNDILKIINIFENYLNYNLNLELDIIKYLEEE